MANPASLRGFDVNPQNIGSKPKGAVSRSTRLKKVIKELMANGEPHAVDKIFKAMIDKACARGDVAAASLILDALYGKQKEKAEVEHKGQMSFAEMVVAADKKSKEPVE